MVISQFKYFAQLIRYSNKKNITANFSNWEISKLRNTTEIEIETIHPDDKISIDLIMQNVLLEERWAMFRQPVDFSEYPDYYATIPYPMCFELIHKRLNNKYYRHNAVYFMKSFICNFLEFFMGHSSNYGRCPTFQ
jgi:hypothetical protein